MKIELPPYFKPLFWSYDFSRMDAKRDMRRVIVDTINYGSWRHWKWIVENYGKQTVKNIIKAVPASAFRPGALRLASLLLSLGKQEYAQRSAYARRT